MPPTLVRLTCRALERGRRSPRRGDERLLYACPGLRCDVRLAGPVTSVAIGPVRPPPPSQHHPGHCITIPYTVGIRGDKTPPRRLLCARRPPVSRTLESNCRMTTPRPPPLKPLLGGHRARHDAPPEARLARTAVHSIVLCAIPPHVARTVRHACKLPPPWPIKGGAVPWLQGGRQRALTDTPSVFTMILALSSISTSGTWRSGLLSRLACSPPSASTSVQRNIVPRAHPCWMYGPGQNQDKTLCH
jgi:hypothetical protein